MANYKQAPLSARSATLGSTLLMQVTAQYQHLRNSLNVHSIAE